MQYTVFMRYPSFHQVMLFYGFLLSFFEKLRESLVFLCRKKVFLNCHESRSCPSVEKNPFPIVNLP